MWQHDNVDTPAVEGWLTKIAEKYSDCSVGILKDALRSNSVIYSMSMVVPKAHNGSSDLLGIVLKHHRIAVEH